MSQGLVNYSKQGLVNYSNIGLVPRLTSYYRLAWFQNCINAHLSSSKRFSDRLNLIYEVWRGFSYTKISSDIATIILDMYIQRSVKPLILVISIML